MSRGQPSEALHRLASVGERRGAGEWRELSDELIEHSSHGFLLADSSGAVVGMNPHCRELLAEQLRDPEHQALRCCDLVCERVAGSGTSGCLTRRTLSASRTTPEITVELPRGDAEAVWVSAAALRPGEGPVLFHLRPRAPRQRRRPASSTK